MAARERHGGGAGAAAPARERRSCGKCMHARAGDGWAWLRSACGAAGEEWHDTAGAVMSCCQITSHEAAFPGNIVKIRYIIYMSEIC